MNFKNPRHWGGLLILVSLVCTMLYIGWSMLMFAREAFTVVGPSLVYVTVMSFALALMVLPFLQSAKMNRKYQDTTVAILDASICDKANELERLVADGKESYEGAQKLLDSHWISHIAPSISVLTEDHREYLAKLHETKKSGLNFLFAIRA